MKLKDELIAEGIEATNAKIAKLHNFCELLRKWNKTHSLTASTTDERLFENIIDSLYPVKFLPDFESCIDIGSGAGFPAIPLAILYDEKEFVLTEPLIKKYAFLQMAKIELGLKNVTVHKKRLEETEARKYDLITSRAVADSKFLVGLSKPFIKDGGYLLFYKGERAEAETEGLDARIINKDRRNYILIKDKSC